MCLEGSYSPPSERYFSPGEHFSSDDRSLHPSGHQFSAVGRAPSGDQYPGMERPLTAAQPTDRRLSADHQLAGHEFGYPGGSVGFGQPAAMIHDLSYFTEDERRIIEKVMRRQKEEEEKDSEIVR